MRSAFICLTLAIVFSTVFSQRPIVRYSENLKKAVPHHYNHDQKNTDRSLDKIARGHKIEPPLPPLRAHSEVPWLRWVQEGRWAAQADKNSELHKVRARLLEEKLKPNNFAFRPQINPQLKPKLKRKENVRHKREAMMPQVPEVIMQPDNEVKLSQPHEQMQRKTEGLEKRDKRQILYFINKPPKLLARSPRTTPNPFIRDTHIEDYDIIRPEVGEREGMIPTIEAGSSDLGSYPLVKIPQALFRFLQIAKMKIQQSYLTKTKQINKSSSIKEEAHIRVKRRMSRFIRDRKQITRKKKIGRAKKTKVKRTPVKMRKWYDKRQKVKKKGDGTYRGGRGRIPRQHKRPRHYKPPMNETSDYDYYDSKGGIRGEEKKDGPDVADYLSYVSGEYSDTEEALKANQEMEKEYQEQLKRRRLRDNRITLSNDTVESPEYIDYESYSESSESKTRSETEIETVEEITEGNKVSEEKERKEGKDKKVKTKVTKENKKSVSKKKTYKKIKQKPKEISEKSEEEVTDEESGDLRTEEDSNGERSSKEDDSKGEKTEDESSDSESNGESDEGEKQKTITRKYKKSPRWKQGKTGRYESDPRKIKNKEKINNKGNVKPLLQVNNKNIITSSKIGIIDDAISVLENKDTIKHKEKKSTTSKSQASANVRKAARKFNFFSLSSYPIIRNFMTAGESQSMNPQRNFIHSQEDQPSNRISSLRFEPPPHIAIQRLQSMPLKPSPDAESLTNPNLVSSGGHHLQSLQSKRADIPLQSTVKERKLTSVAQEKPRDTLTLISQTKDERKKWTSTGTDHMGSIQSLKIDPVVLASITKNIPQLNIDKNYRNDTLINHDKTPQRGSIRHVFPQQSKIVNTRARGPDILTSIAKNIPHLNIDDKEINTDFKRKDIGQDTTASYALHKSTEVNAQSGHETMEQKVVQEVEHNLQEEKNKNKKMFKREIKQKDDKELSYEELSFIPESAGASIPSDEIESASDDKF